MSMSKRLLGIDYGSKRVGVAVSDPGAQFAIPLNTVTNTADLVNVVDKIAKDNEVGEIVLGESRNYAGEPNDILLKSIKFKTALEKMGYVVHFEQEFMTSIQAERIQGKTELTDASAAALILQSFLDRRINEKNN